MFQCPGQYARLIAWLLCAGIIATAPAFGEDALDPKGVEFFENKIRPVLVEHCYKCHSAAAEKVKGALYLDTRAGMLKGGKSGEPAIVAGDAAKSLLMKALRYDDAELQMPPKERLPAARIADFDAWIKMGAPDPRTGAGTQYAAAAKHWAFQPIAKHSNGDRDGSPTIDAFISKKLAEKGLQPSPPAEKRALLRRATYDLTGLPPTPEEIAAFLVDVSPNAFEKVVDRLLASPRYGERWAQHWLDVVRYGESNGYEQNHLRPNAWHYRDYVIRAFNSDKPYTDFVAEQLAGDVLAKDDPTISVATGFLVAGVHDTVGNQAEEGARQQRADDLDDIVSTTGSAFLGLTVGCAKCHDHKFDPIPQQDFYRMAAVFAGVRHEEREITAAPPAQVPSVTEIARDLRAVGAELADIEALAREAVLRAQNGKDPRRPSVQTQRNVEDFSSAPVTAKFVRLTVTATNNGVEPCIDEIEIYADVSGENIALASKGAKAAASSLLPGYAIHQIAHLNDGRYGNEWSWISAERNGGWAQIELASAAKISKVVWSRDNEDKPRLNDRLATGYRMEFSDDGKTWRAGSSSETREASSEAIPASRLVQSLSPPQTARREKLLAERERLRGLVSSASPPKAYAGRFTTPDTIFLLKRGSVMQRGDVIAPGALTKIPGVDGALKLDSASEPARRVALAKWICEEKNPLTARVLVNRVWQHHFGRGIVSTPSDFGANGTAPTQPELLDWLAADFMTNGWKIKRLHRMIMLSSTYRQSSLLNEKAAAVDASNLLLWQMPLQRLEAEALRDSILAVSGKLNLQMGGPGYQLFKYRVVNIAIYEPLDDPGPATWRRTIYQQAPRAIRENLLAAYDLPENAQRAPRREVTTTPLQALTNLNSNFVVTQAGFMAARLQAGNRGLHEQIALAFELCFGRPPTAEESKAAEEFVARQGLAAFCRAMMNANEFITY